MTPSSSTLPVWPEIAVQAWEQREGPVILATASVTGIPNAVYLGVAGRTPEGRIYLANNYFHKTLSNLTENPEASLLFKTTEGRSFQLKGRISFHSTGPLFDAMKAINPPRHPGHSAAVIDVHAIYSGEKQLM